MNFTKQALGTLCGALLVTGAAWAQKGETVKIAWIDPLSGPFANIGQNSLKTFQFMAEKLNAGNPAGVKFEIVSFDKAASAIAEGIVTALRGSRPLPASADCVAYATERYAWPAIARPRLSARWTAFMHVPSGSPDEVLPYAPPPRHGAELDDPISIRAHPRRARPARSRLSPPLPPRRTSFLARRGWAGRSIFIWKGRFPTPSQATTTAYTSGARLSIPARCSS